MQDFCMQEFFLCKTFEYKIQNVTKKDMFEKIPFPASKNNILIPKTAHFVNSRSTNISFFKYFYSENKSVATLRLACTKDCLDKF